MKSNLMTPTPATGLSSFAARERACASSALLPNLAGHGTALSFAGQPSVLMAAAAQAAVAGVRSTDLTASVPRGAPV